MFSVYDAEDRYDQRFIENYAKINLIPEVQRVPGVGDANVLGTDYSMLYLVEAGCDGTV